MENIFIIEHLDGKMHKWSLIEYKSASRIVGKDNLWVTNVKGNDKNVSELRKHAKVLKESVKEMKLQKVCVLDPDANKLLVTADKNGFTYFIFGGILGDYPPRKRTKEELTRFLPDCDKRNIGKKQFSTDNAIYVTHEILSGKEFAKMKFKNKLTIKMDEILSLDLPYYYPVIEGKQRISDELLDYLKKKKGF